MKSAFESARTLHIFPCLSIVFVSTRNLCSHRPTAGLHLLRLQLSQLPLVATHRLHLPLANQVWIPVPLSEHAERRAVASFILDNVSGSLIGWFTEHDNQDCLNSFFVYCQQIQRYHNLVPYWTSAELALWTAISNRRKASSWSGSEFDTLTAVRSTSCPDSNRWAWGRPFLDIFFCQNGLIERWEAFSALLSQDLGQIIWECPWADSVKTTHMEKHSCRESDCCWNQWGNVYIRIYIYVFIIDDRWAVDWEPSSILVP